MTLNMAAKLSISTGANGSSDRDNSIRLAIGSTSCVRDSRCEPMLIINRCISSIMAASCPTVMCSKLSLRARMDG